MRDNARHEQHYEITRQVFRYTALYWQGYYDSRPGKPLQHSRWQRRVRSLVLALLDARCQREPRLGRVLDVGCGRGDFSIELATRYPQLTEVWGCDFSPEALAIASASAKPFGNVFFKEADILAMPFEDDSFDATLCINVLHHIHSDDLERALGELARITRQCIILEIKNRRNPYYACIGSRRIDPVGRLKVFPTSTAQVSDALKRRGFRLTAAEGIFVLKWLSPLLVLTYEKNG